MQFVYVTLFSLFDDRPYVVIHRDLKGLEVIVKQHQELKAKIDGRSNIIHQCADLGKILIAAGNPASEEVSLTIIT